MQIPLTHSQVYAEECGECLGCKKRVYFVRQGQTIPEGAESAALVYTNPQGLVFPIYLCWLCFVNFVNAEASRFYKKKVKKRKKQNS